MLAVQSKYENQEESLDWNRLIGYEMHLKRLASLHSAGNLPPVLLIEGREGLGKRIFAAAVASLYYCEYGTGCGKCERCLEIVRQDEPDLFWFDSQKKTIKIHDIERVQEHLAFNPSLSQSSLKNRGVAGTTRSSYRVAAMVDIDLMTEQSANRILKTIEEPHSNARIILTTSRIGNVLPTILSRTVKYHVAPPPLELAIAWLKRELKERGGQLPSDDVLVQTLELHGLAPGRALQQLLTDEEGEESIYHQMAELIFHRNTDDLLNKIKVFSQSKSLNISDLVQHVEILLNQYYKLRLGLEYNKHVLADQKLLREVSFRELIGFREILRNIRKVTARTQVPINKQLTMEALALHRFM